MSNVHLLEIEKAFLNSTAVKRALNMTAIATALQGEASANRKKFENTLKIAHHAQAVCTWFASEEGKALCAEHGIVWGKEAIGLKIFGLKKAHFYRTLKAGGIAPEVVEEFQGLCDTAEAEGDKPNRSLEGLIQFAEKGTSPTGDGEEGEGEAEAEDKPETIFTMTYKGQDGKTVSVRLDNKGGIKTTNTPAEIVEAAKWLLSEMGVDIEA